MNRATICKIINMLIYELTHPKLLNGSVYQCKMWEYFLLYLNSISLLQSEICMIMVCCIFLFAFSLAAMQTVMHSAWDTHDCSDTKHPFSHGTEWKYKHRRAKRTQSSLWQTRQSKLVLIAFKFCMFYYEI